jgi:hypothetical protein
MKGFRLVRQACVACLVFLAMGSAHADDWKAVGQFGWFGVGKAFEIEKGHFYWVGEFSGTFFNDKGKGLFHLSGVKCPAYFDADMNNNKAKAGGYCIIADPDGDQVYVAWQTAGGVASSPGSFQYFGGTGKYKSIGTGVSYPFTGVTQINWADGTTSGYAIWNR